MGVERVPVTLEELAAATAEAGEERRQILALLREGRQERDDDRLDAVEADLEDARQVADEIIGLLRARNGSRVASA